jgi:DNA-directed RNA polymerase subunit RPC12/RpoP
MENKMEERPLQSNSTGISNDMKDFIEIKCPHCNQPYKIPKPFKSTTYYCSKCLKAFFISVGIDDAKTYPLA